MKSIERVFAAVLSGIAMSNACAETYTVGPESPGTIQALIDLVLSSGDVIQLEAGTYLLPDQIVIRDLDITIRGVLDEKSSEPLSILSGQDAHRIALINTSVCHFDSIVFERGSAQNNGGAALIVGGANTFARCHFRSNHAHSSSGGAVYGPSDFEDCSFLDNSASEGGAVSYNVSPTCSFTNCTFTNNSASGRGGAVWFCGDRFYGCEFSGNSAGSAGGAVYGPNGDYADCSFVNNQAGSNGGSLYFYNTNATITDCSFLGNSATNGGGVYRNDGSLDLVGCIVEGNIASESGGGLFLNDTATANVTNSSICENTPDNIHGPWVDGGGNDSCGLPQCIEDMNNDGVVNSTELGLVLTLWGTTNPLADLDGNGIVGSPDLGLVLGSWGPCR